MAEQIDHKNESSVQAKELAHALVYTGPMVAAIEPASMPPLGNNDIILQTLKSGISRGTESLVFAGRVPKNEWERMRCPHQVGKFSFPVSYGYALVGEVIETGKDVNHLVQGNIVFALHPHQSHALINATYANKVPDTIPPQRAVLAANMETALNALWDSDVTADDTVSVIGAGVVGLLTAYLANKVAQTNVAIIDIDESKRAVADSLGLSFFLPQDAPQNNNVIFHTSASGIGLQTALDLAAFEGRIIEMSWYGDKEVPLQLGGAFHSQRLSIISSQVGHISPSRRATTSYAQRMAEALNLLNDPALDALLETEIAFKALPDHLNRILGPNSNTLCQVVDYTTSLSGNPSGD
ncbi:MAG: zinc-binding alcohol dehydrogenase [Hyphomicrobiales bacterium]